MRLNKSLSKRLLKPNSRNIFGNDSLGGTLAYAYIFKEKLDQSCHWLIKHKYILFVCFLFWDNEIRNGKMNVGNIRISYLLEIYVPKMARILILAFYSMLMNWHPQLSSAHGLLIKEVPLQMNNLLRKPRPN